MSVGDVYCTYPVNLARYFAKYIAFNALFLGSFFYIRKRIMPLLAKVIISKLVFYNI